MYAHIDVASDISENLPIKKGRRLGTIAPERSFNPYSPHLHFELRRGSNTVRGSGWTDSASNLPQGQIDLIRTIMNLAGQPNPTPPPQPTPTPAPAARVPVTPTAIGPGTAREPGPQQSGNRVTLEWNAVSGASEYDLGVRDLVTNQLVFDRRVSGTAQRVTLEPGRRYRWNVAACNAAGCSRFTAPLHFALAAGSSGGGGSGGSPAAAVPAVPRDLSPGRSSEPGQRLSIASTTLQWAEVRGATRYELELRDLTAKRDIAVGPLTQRFHIFKMKKGAAYRWRVRACNASGCSAWSQRLFFTAP
jgi:hypothetical protein